MASIRRTVGVLSGTVFLVMIGISIMNPDIPQYGRVLGATPFMAGALVGALPAARVRPANPLCCEKRFWRNL